MSIDVGRVNEYLKAESANRAALAELGIPDERDLSDLSAEERAWYEPICKRELDLVDSLDDESYAFAIEERERRTGEAA